MFKATILSTIFFLLFNIYGIAIQVIELIKKSSSGEVAGILNLNTFFNSPTPFYILQFTAITLLVITIFIISNAYFSIAFAKKIKQKINNTYCAISIWLIISNTSLMVLNAAYFRHSDHLTEWFRIWPENHLNIYIMWFFLIFPIVYTAWSASKLKFVFISAALISIYSLYTTKDSVIENRTSEAPNIILIGIDSLRSDLLYSHMPFLASQLKESTIYPTTFTPLGRTFPAWNSILTGLNPINHGARINLIPETQLISTDRYLPSVLKSEGYKTIFAIDETRFANIGEHQGFEQTITPRVGASDFLITSISDLPLINLLSLNPISQWLLPEIYANRGAAKTYRSNAFTTLINNELPPASQPTFLAVHFCLAHWPFIFSTKMNPDANHSQPYYPLNVTAVDNQIKDFFNILERKGYLQNSRIIFLSDHGEAWVEESVSYKSEENSFFRKEYGHGSSLTSHSNQVLLSFKNFKSDQIDSNRMKTASLIDITPTILSELQISKGFQFDGVSLTDNKMPNDRVFQIESGTTLSVDESDNININDIIDKFLDRYELTPSGLIVIREERIEEGLKSKIYGIRNTQFILETSNDNSFKLFNQANHSFEEFKDFSELKLNQPKWSQAWCDTYKTERKECQTE
ncbi:MAG: sulfatase-like hydrolase/transferase [Bermanella sp.]